MPLNSTRLFCHPFVHPSHCRRGLTLVEVLIASAIGAMVAIGVMSLALVASRLNRSIVYQQLSIRECSKAIEALNREIRLATTPLTVVDADGNSVPQGNRVVFARVGESAGHRAFELVSLDDDLMTPWDNTLVYDPDTSTSGDEIVVARWLTPTNPAGVFSYSSAITPLVVQMRAGDPEGLADNTANDARSGPGLQGMEINITVAPRN